MKQVLPKLVYYAITEHLRLSGNRAHRNWDINRAHEDSLTGAAFADFLTRRTRRVFTDGGEWHWRVCARKFGSAGKGSEEKRTGADGIIEIEVKHLATGFIEQKGLIVQAKKEWTGANKSLLDQVWKMENFAAGSSAAIVYSASGYKGVDGRDIIAADGNRHHLPDSRVLPLGSFLADRFLTCEVGCRSLYYDPRRKLLNPPGPGRIKFPIRERMRIEIEEMSR